MFKKFSIGMFAVAASFGFVATSLPAYGQCSNCQGSGASLQSYVGAPMSVGSSQMAVAQSVLPSIRSYPTVGNTSGVRSVPYRSSKVSSQSQIPFYFLSKPERNGGHGN